MILGPPRSGKTSAVMIPALMACLRAAVSTSTKPDVMRATIPARAEIGEVWLFDPAGSETPRCPRACAACAGRRSAPPPAGTRRS